MKIKFFFIGLLTLIGVNLEANCENSLRQEASRSLQNIYQQLELFEERLLQAESYVESAEHLVKGVKFHYENAKKFFSQLEEKVLVQESDPPEKIVTLVQDELAKTENLIEIFLLRLNNTHLNTIYQQPISIMPDRVYSIDNPDDSTIIGVSLSTDVVADVFWSNQDVRKKVAKQLLKQLVIDGFNRGFLTRDIKWTIPDRSILMLGVPPITGVGAYRFLGYLDDKILRIVTWSNDSDHGTESKLFRQGFPAIKKDRQKAPFK